ncbi:metallophosphoesterase family protein [Runella salmonicolor]|uniref:Metallophosphoesterase n=1 Tax=Runella salmonicolor TaxID=2950278 RepID=A0ABT1FVD1_9BACT|nr:metallophosphoesterase [Runella salmonicolor]MCP1385725.1 metallophosphoesterase [Runella salmonicolor]
MKRRTLLSSLALAPLAIHAKNTTQPTLLDRGTFAIDANRVRFFNTTIRERFSILFVADTHLFIDDARGEPYRQYSARMAKAYNQTKHFQTGEPTNPEKCFQETLAIAQKEGVSLVALIGDIMSFPSEAAVDWVSQQLKTANLPYVYTAGNHDWHYEGMSGSARELRDTWTKKRLFPLYQGENPLMTVREVKGVRFVVIDNSIYEILPEQLAFFRKEVATGKPLVLMVHIPLYAPERGMGFGCGHPEWSAKTDRNYELERRQRWPEAGHTEVTMAFHKEAMKAPNLLGVFAGHTHNQSLDVVNGLPQIVTNPNATGAYLKIEFVPQPG